MHTQMSNAGNILVCLAILTADDLLFSGEFPGLHYKAFPDDLFFS